MTVPELFAYLAVFAAPFALRSMWLAQRDPDVRAVAEHRRRMDLLAPKVETP